MSKMLLLVHVEDTFHRLGHLDEEILRNIQEAIEGGDFDRVVHATSCIEDMHPHQWVRWMVDQEIEWGWGYEPDSFMEDERDYVIPSLGHEWTWVPPEFRNGFFKGWDVFLGGGADGECLTDMECVLDHIEVPYKKVYDLIY